MMRIVKYICKKCGEERTTTKGTIYDREKICGACRRKLGLVSEESKHLQKELERLQQGKELNENDKKGILLEYAVSETLDGLGIPHEHNPFDITYPCYQEENPDIIIEALDTVIECKNLSKSQTDHLTPSWIDRNVIDRPKVNAFEEKIVVFGYPLKLSLKKYLKGRGWRTCGIGNQILTPRQAYDAIPRLKQELYWLREKMKAREELPSYAST
jgi:hypothetical protein